MVASAARAHTEGAPISPHDFWTAWSLQLTVVVPIAVALLLYGRGLHLAWSRAGIGRGTAVWRAGLFALGLIALLAGLVWPLDTAFVRQACGGSAEIMVVEEKRGIIESQFKEYFYDWPGDKPKKMVGKYHAAGEPLIPWVGELSPLMLVPVVQRRHRKLLTKF